MSRIVRVLCSESKESAPGEIGRDWTLGRELSTEVVGVGREHG